MVTDQEIISLIHDGDITLQDIDIYKRLSLEAQRQALSAHEYALSRFAICLRNECYRNKILIINEQFNLTLYNLLSVFKEVIGLCALGIDADSIFLQLNNKTPSRPASALPRDLTPPRSPVVARTIMPSEQTQQTDSSKRRRIYQHSLG